MRVDCATFTYTYQAARPAPFYISPLYRLDLQQLKTQKNSQLFGTSLAPFHFSLPRLALGIFGATVSQARACGYSYGLNPQQNVELLLEMMNP